MTTTPTFEMSSGWKNQSPEVRERFAKLKKRPVTLDVYKLCKSYDSPQGDKASGKVVALEDITFRAYRRELLCVIGPSGCGKSTLARVIAGLDPATSGELLVGGKPVTGPGADRGMVFQGYTLFPWLTVKKNVMFGLQVAKKWTEADAEQEARRWLELVGLTRFESAYPHQLSGGMKQRVAIARALANRPSVLLMDEPFGALDAQTRAQMQAYLLQLWKEVDITIVFITHDLDEAIYLADRVLVLDAHPGRVRELMENPVPRPRSPKQFLSQTFIDAKRHLEELIHPPVEVPLEALPIIRMTEVGDDVE